MPDLYFRDGTLDRDIWEEVTTHNIYELPDRFGANDVILDIGAHIGAFAFACMKRGAGKVHCYEASWDNVKSLVHNLHTIEGWQDRCIIHHLAVVGHGNSYGHVNLESYPVHSDGRLNTGGCGIGYGMETVGAIDIVQISHMAVRLMKLDCEGSEWQILSRMIECRRFAQEICGEYHEFTNKTHPCMRDDLIAILSKQDYKVTVTPIPDTNLGRFWAKR